VPSRTGADQWFIFGTVGEVMNELVHPLSPRLQGACAAIGSGQCWQSRARTAPLRSDLERQGVCVTPVRSAVQTQKILLKYR
jgi:hypothetical protein